MTVYIPTWAEWIVWPLLCLAGIPIALIIVSPFGGGDYDFFSPIAALVIILAWLLLVAVMMILRVAYF